MKYRTAFLLAILTITGCASQHEYYHKEFKVEIREDDHNETGEIKPSIRATIRIHN